ncbi:hypothetical protein ACLOJK_006876 [Asimina triloba]
MDISTFSQIDTFHWILDMNTFVGEAYEDVKEICIFLLNALSLPPDKALAVYVQSPGSPFVFCGAVSVARPSAVLALSWPNPGGQMQLAAADTVPLTAKIGVSVEDLAALPSLDVAAERRIERMAMKVGENLFNFMHSFCSVDGSRLVVPMDILARWFKKFQERAKRDPDYLKALGEELYNVHLRVKHPLCSEMLKRLMNTNPNSFRKLVQMFLEASGHSVLPFIVEFQVFVLGLSPEKLLELLIKVGTYTAQINEFRMITTLETDPEITPWSCTKARAERPDGQERRWPCFPRRPSESKLEEPLLELGEFREIAGAHEGRAPLPCH